MTKKQFQITDEFDDCFYIREKDDEALTTAKDFENKLNEQYEIIQTLKQELFEAKKDCLIETAGISDKRFESQDNIILDAEGESLKSIDEIVDVLNELDSENDFLYDNIIKFEKENEQLKQKIKSMTETLNKDKQNKIFIQSHSIKPEYGGNFNL